MLASLLRSRVAAPLLGVALLAVACSDDDVPAPAGSSGAGGAGVGGGGGAGGDLGIPCGASGVSKGPWVVGATTTGAKIRWEACREGTAAGLSLTPEGGGAALRATSIETPFDVTETYTSPLNPDAPPDLAGRYYMHEAALADLAPSTCYAYLLDASAEDPGGLAGRFCTARASGEPFRFMAIGDTNPALGDSTTKVLAQAIPTNPDFVVHAGDIQYYDSTLETWALWFPIMAPMLRQGSFFPSIGNHESEKPTELAEYYTRFFAGAGVGELEYYRFDSGGVSFFSLDTELDFGAGSVQAGWLEAGLGAAAGEAGHRFSVVLLHRPFVTCGDSADHIPELDHLTPIFEANGVSLVIQGHMHGYERFEIGPITFVTTAGGGGQLGDVDENIARPECAMREASGAFFHSMIFDVSAGMLAGEALDEAGVVQDSFAKAVPQ